MSKSMNRVLLIGNLGNDPEIKYTASGTAIANLSVATSESWKDKQSGQLQTRTEWNRIVAYGKLAEIMGEYLFKGSRVFIEGSLRTRKWQDKDGTDKYTTEIVATELISLDSKSTGDAHKPPANNNRPPQDGHTAAAQQQPPSFDDFDDDIPW